MVFSMVEHFWKCRAGNRFYFFFPEIRSGGGLVVATGYALYGDFFIHKQDK